MKHPQCCLITREWGATRRGFFSSVWWWQTAGLWHKARDQYVQRTETGEVLQQHLFNLGKNREFESKRLSLEKVVFARLCRSLTCHSREHKLLRKITCFHSCKNTIWFVFKREKRSLPHFQFLPNNCQAKQTEGREMASLQTITATAAFHFCKGCCSLKWLIFLQKQPQRNPFSPCGIACPFVLFLDGWCLLVHQHLQLLHFEKHSSLDARLFSKVCFVRTDSPFPPHETCNVIASRSCSSCLPWHYLFPCTAFPHPQRPFWDPDLRCSWFVRAHIKLPTRSFSFHHGPDHETSFWVSFTRPLLDWARQSRKHFQTGGISIHPWDSFIPQKWNRTALPSVSTVHVQVWQGTWCTSCALPDFCSPDYFSASSSGHVEEVSGTLVNAFQQLWGLQTARKHLVSFSLFCSCL